MITASVNIAPLLAKCAQFRVAFPALARPLVADQAKLFISSSGNNPGMVQVTPPFSKGTSQSQARKQGEAKVYRDIRRVYGIPSDLYALIKQRDPKLAAVFWGLVLREKWEEASKLSQRITSYRLVDFDNGAAHKLRHKTPDGNVSGRHFSMFLRDPVGRKGELSEYIKKIVARVGIYVSGFNAAAQALGAKGVPAWALRHGNQFSGISIQEGANSFYITISDKVPFGESDTVRRMRYTAEYRSNALARQMPYVVRAALKKAGFVTTGSLAA